MPYVYSTASTHVKYTQYGEAPQGARRPVVREVVVKGGANVANKHLITPLGVRTDVSNEDAAFLAMDANFIRHQKAGFVRLTDHKVDPEVVAADLTSRDGSSPLVEADYDKGKAPKVVTVA